MAAEEFLVDERWLGLWVTHGKAVWIERGEGAAAFRVTVRAAPDALHYRRGDLSSDGSFNYTYPKDGTLRMPAAWVTRRGRSALRLPFLQVEAERSRHGRTYALSFALANPSSQRYRWRAALPLDPVSEVRLVPDTGAGFVDTVTRQGDEAEIPWAKPLEPLRKAGGAEEAAYRERWS